LEAQPDKKQQGTPSFCLLSSSGKNFSTVKDPHLTHCQTVAADDVGGMYLVPDKLVGALQQFGCKNHNGSRAVANLLVLELS
jgi:hypothetical protein